MSSDKTVPQYVLDSVGSLPPLPASVQRLLEIVHSDDADFKEISSVVEMDQTLTARTLRAANSALYGASRRISTVRQATVMLGSEAIVNLALSISVMNLQNSLKKKWPLSPDAFWEHNMAVAIAARTLSKELGDAKPDQAFVAGLLHDIGKLILMQHFGVSYGQVVLAAQDGTEPLHLLEREIFDIDHGAVGNALCKHWNIPSPIARAVADHHDDEVASPGSLADVVRDANDLVKSIGLGNSGNPYTQLRSRPYLSQDRLPSHRLHEIVLNLPADVWEAQEAFGGGNDTEQPTPKTLEDAPMVALHVTTEEERKMLENVLAYMGYKPTHRSTARDHGQPTGAITDAPLNEDDASWYARHDVPILDLAAWRSINEQSLNGYFHVPRLHEWIRDGLPAGRVQAA